MTRYGRTHGPFSVEAAVRSLGLGPALVRESVGRLAAEGTLEPIGYPAAAAADGEGEENAAAEGVPGQRGASIGGERAWVDAGVLRRLRARSLARARQAAAPVPTAAYGRFLLDRQAVGPQGGLLEGVEGVAEVIAQFEGVFMTMEQWECGVLPRRVRRYRPALLDELVATGEVVWAARREEPAVPPSRGSRRAPAAEPTWKVALFPADSPLAPVPLGLAQDPVPGAAAEPGREGLTEPPTVVQALQRVLAEQAPLGFPQMVEEVGALLASEPVEAQAVAEALADLVAAGRAAADDWAFPGAGGLRSRVAASGIQGLGQQPPPRSRARSRRSRSRYAEAKREARQHAVERLADRAAFDGALSGRWHLLAPDQASSTLHAVALAESLLDRYGLVTADIALQGGVLGGLAALYPVLRQMEEAGDVLRGAFVEGLGPAQFAERATIEALRDEAKAREGSGAGPSEEEGPGPKPREGRPAGGPSAAVLAVLAADDPATLYGAGLPWPPIAWEATGAARPDDASLLTVRPSRRAGALVVLADGAPALYAAPRLKSLVAFTDDPALLAAAARALAGAAAVQAKAPGGAGARAKLLVETLNGMPVVGTPAADVLEGAGFVRQPNGLRLYVDPF